jgi:hypothetical protein
MKYKNIFFNNQSVLTFQNLYLGELCLVALKLDFRVVLFIFLRLVKLNNVVKEAKWFYDLGGQRNLHWLFRRQENF